MATAEQKLRLKVYKRGDLWIVKQPWQPDTDAVAQVSNKADAYIIRDRLVASAERVSA